MSEEEFKASVLRRLDQQDELLKEIHDWQVAHAATYEQIKPALEEVVTFWKGSRVLARILSVLAGMAVTFAGVWAYLKDHLK